MCNCPDPVEMSQFQINKCSLSTYYEPEAAQPKRKDVQAKRSLDFNVLGKTYM